MDDAERSTAGASGGLAAREPVFILGDASYGRPSPTAGSPMTLSVGPSRVPIHARFWNTERLPDGSVPKGLVVFSHGYGHYQDGLFSQLAAEFGAIGFACAGYDQPGHGRSGMEPGLVPSLEACKDALVATRKEAVSRIGRTVPVVCYAESMGAAVAILAAASAPGLFDKLVLMWPLLALPSPPSGLAAALVTCVGSICPGLVIRSASPPGPDTFSDPAKQLQAAKDDLRYEGGLKSRTASVFIGASASLRGTEGLITCPVLIIHAQTDTICSHAASFEWFSKLPASTRSRFITVEAGAHNLW
jgi:alpha-beta hydrolase superfamily lysophospholipase